MNNFLVGIVFGIAGFLVSVFMIKLPMKWAGIIGFVCFSIVLIATSSETHRAVEGINEREETEQHARAQGRGFEEGRMEARQNHNKNNRFI